MKLELRYPDPSGTKAENEKIEGCKIGVWTKKALQNKHCEDVREQRWQGIGESSIQHAGRIKMLMVRVSCGCQSGKQHRHIQ